MIYRQVTLDEYKQLNKLANRIKKLVREIDECGWYAPQTERIAISGAISAATDFLNVANDIYRNEPYE